MSSYTISANLLISEVAKRPAIWDLRSTDNKCLMKKEKAWDEVAMVYFSDYDSLSMKRKAEVCRTLQSKWRNLRDNYVRSLRRRGKDQEFAEYAYGRSMTFLDPVYETRPTRKRKSRFDLDAEPAQSLLHVNIHNGCSGEESDRESEDRLVDDTLLVKRESSSDEEIPSIIDNFKRRRPKRRENEFVLANEEIETTSTKSPDEDKLFFDSLLPVVHKFDLDQKLEFRTQILQLIKRMRSTSQTVYNISMNEY